jgi:hypothetical protein
MIVSHIPLNSCSLPTHRILASGILPMTAKGEKSQPSITPRYHDPRRHETTGMVSGIPPTYPLRPIQSAPADPEAQPSIQLLGISHLASNSDLRDRNSSAEKGKELFESLVYPEGEIPVSEWSIDNARLTGGCPSRSSTKMMLTPGG